MKTNFIEFVLGVVLLSSTAWSNAFAATLAPADTRAKTYIETTTLKADEAYSRMLEWFSKNFGDSNTAIKIKDEKQRKIVGKANVDCSALKLGSGFGADQVLEFSFTAEAKDKKIRLIFEDVTGVSPGSYDSGDRPSSKEEMDKAVAECLDPIKKGILEALSGAKKHSDNW